MRGIDERDIINGCRRGDRDAQRRLFELTSPSIYRLCLKMMSNEADAFDITQNTYVRALEHIAEFDGTAQVTTWLYRIAVNESLQFYRKRRLEAQYQQALSTVCDQEAADGSLDHRIDIQSALQTLRPAERAILLLRYQEGLEYAQIAEVLGCASGTVASRLNRARQRLRGVLEKSYDSREETGDMDYPKKGLDESPQRRREGA